MTTTTTTDDGILTPVAVVPRHDVPARAYVVTAENLTEIAARLQLDVRAEENVFGGAVLEIEFERRYNLRSTARPNDVIIVHPMTTKNLEVLTFEKFDEQYERADRDLLDMTVSEEFPSAYAWALIAAAPEGVFALPGRGIRGVSDIAGIVDLVARSGFRRVAP